MVQTWPSLRTTPNTTEPQNGTEIASRNLSYKDINLLRGWRNLLFTKRHNKEALKKIHANNAKAMSTLAEAIKAFAKPEEVNPKIPKGCSCK